jgi:predicted nuclease of predicted toxin-antitoxin system
VRFLLDQNLSPRLLADLADLYPGSTHARDVGLATADDNVVWGYAAQHGLTIVSKDADFHERSFVLGPPPKVIWIRRGRPSSVA